MEFQETSLLVTVPEGRSFRFEDCTAYERVKGKAMKEMDVGWLSPDDELWLVELKDYGQHVPASIRRAVTKLKNQLPDKVRDALTMLSAAWAGTTWGQDLKNDIQSTCPPFPASAPVLRVGIVINVDDPSDIALLSQIKDRITADLRGELEILGVRSIVVLPASPSQLQNIPGLSIQETSTL